MVFTRSLVGALVVVLALMASPVPSAAQEPLTLAEAMGRARTATAAARALGAASGEADERVRQARAGYLPRVDLTERVQRGTQPVFVFSSLLSQRRFSAANFAIEELNNPAPLTNVRTGVIVDQAVFDGGLTRLRVEQAEIGREIAAAVRASSTQDLAVRAAAAFIEVLQLDAAQRASRGAVDAADSDVARARARRDVGVATDADVLAVEVHLAEMRQRAIAAEGDLEVARIGLREAIGAPADADLRLVPPEALPPGDGPGALVREAVALRPERTEAGFQTQLAQNARRSAQAAFLPQASLQGGLEWNGDTFTEQRSSWVIGAEVRINLFRGFGDRARVAEARHAEARAEAEREGIERRIEVEVRTALARLDTARARGAAGQAALAQSRESQRVVRDRYDNGLATITDVLRAAEAALDAESRATAAEMDIILHSVLLDRAVGRL